MYYDFDRDIKAYFSEKSKLLSKHRGKFAAIYKGQVVAIDSNKNNLIARVRREFGHGRTLIKKIEDEEPKAREPVSRRLTSS